MNQLTTRNATNLMDHLNVKFNELKADFKEELLQEFRKMLNEQNSLFNNLIQMNKKNESNISVLQTQISNVTASNLSMQGQIKELEERVNRVEGQTYDNIDILEQFSRRQSLRIEGVKINENADEVDPVMEIVESCFNEAGLTYSSTVIDRAHRVGPVYKN